MLQNHVGFTLLRGSTHTTLTLGMLSGTGGVEMIVYMGHLWRRRERVFVLAICGLIMLFAFVYLL